MTGHLPVSQAAPLDGLVDTALTRSLRHLELGRETFPLGAFPYVSEGNRYRGALVTVGPDDVPPWTAGFWPGQLLLAHALTGEEELLTDARRWTTLLGERLREHGEGFDHDLGFQFLLTAVADHRLTGDDDARALGLQAADRLVDRFNPHGGFIRAHGWPGSPGQAVPEPGTNDGPAGRFIADTLMNVPLLFWAADVTGEDRYTQIARRHCATSLRYLLREDGWVYHAFDLDPRTGEPVGPATIQGASVDSAWSRAQAWALYGFALAGWRLADERLLAAATTVADSFIAACGTDPIPPWDFDRPQGDKTLADSSAGAIAASGLVALAEMHPAAARGERYRSAAVALLAALEERCSTNVDAGEEGLLGRACYHYREQIGLQESASWGDYFYLEAIARLRGVPVPYDLGATAPASHEGP